MRPQPDRSPLEHAYALADTQDGAVSTGQLRALGMSASAVRAQVRARRWQRVHPKAYATFTGPLPYRTRVSAAVLHAGAGALASHETAAWLHGMVDAAPAGVVVTVPWERRVQRQPGLRVVRSRRVTAAAHPARCPPQTRVEDTVLDLVAASSAVDEVVGWITRACQRRLTTPGKLAAAVATRPRQRWRGLVEDVLADVVDGVLSALERRWQRDVERAHGLPRGSRNRPEGTPGRRRYRDVRYRRWRVVVELDGQAAHPVEDRHRDRRRDNSATLEGSAVLAYGWLEVAGSPCRCASDVARLIRAAGWTGRLRRCGPDCPVGPDP